MGYVIQVTIKACGPHVNYFHSVVLHVFEFILVIAHRSKQRIHIYSLNFPVNLLIKIQNFLMKIVIMCILLQ